MRVDGKGRIFFVEEIDGQLAASTPPATQQGVLDGELAPLDQSFLLHSKLGSQKTIYLNFVGATLTNKAWNWILNRAEIIAPPFDLDGNLNAFSDAELERIQYIWQRVAEDYAPFDVDVTTEPPQPEQISRANSNDQVYGTSVLITQRAGLYDNCGCGGVAFLRQFNNTTDQGKPALVFYDALRGEEKKRLQRRHPMRWATTPVSVMMAHHRPDIISAMVLTWLSVGPPSWVLDTISR